MKPGTVLLASSALFAIVGALMVVGEAWPAAVQMLGTAAIFFVWGLGIRRIGR